MERMKHELTKRKEVLHNSMLKLKGVIALDKEKIETSETLLRELNGRFLEIDRILKEYCEKDKS